MEVPAPNILSIGVFHATEGADLVCTVTFDRVLDAPYSLSYNIGGGTASPADYGTPVFSNGVTIVDGNLLIPAGINSFSVILPTVDDTIDEPTERVPFTFGSFTINGNIYDNDAAPSVSIDSITVNEADGAATFTVTLSAASGQPISVDYASSDGSATAGSDYTAVSGTLNFAIGETSKTITVSINDDSLFEGSEDFTITLSNPTNATLGTAVGTGTIVDDDLPPNQPSVMNPESVTVDEDFFILGNVLSNDSVADDVLRIASYEVNGNTYLAGTDAVIAGIGNITIFSTGDYRFTPEPNYNGPVPVITYTTNTGSSSTLTITVRPVNDAPSAVDDAFVIDEDTPLVISPGELLINDTDVDGDSLTIITIQSASNGSLSVVGGNIVFTPTLDYSGPAPSAIPLATEKAG
ncbi:Calx-beta domain-containing protein [Alishewanella longhuensis]